MSTHFESPPPIGVTFANVSYSIPAPRNPLTRSRARETQILHDISGHVSAGESLAILGPSGCGKTTLLNVLAARSAHAPTGDILFNGRARAPRTKRRIGYVMQDDVFFPALTVRQILDFTADVRLSGVLDAPARRRRVADVVRHLRLDRCADTRVGDQQFDKGISGGERKRLNIANELLHRPSLFLADECTSGLDASSALTVITLLRNLCRENCAVVATIHQPSSQMFALFTNVMLLSQGRVVYFGPPAAVTRYFSAMGFAFPATPHNPADYVLQIIATGHSADVDDSPDEQTAIRLKNDALQRIQTAWRERMDNAVHAQKGRQHIAIEFGPRASDSDASSDGADKDGCPAGADSSSDGANSPDANSFESAKPAEPAASKAPTSLAARMQRALTKRWQDCTGNHGLDGQADKYAAGWWSQVGVLAKRAFRQKRGVLLERSTLAQTVFVIAIVAGLWWGMDAVERTVEDRLGLLTFIPILWTFSSACSIVFSFPTERAVLNKDRAAGTYRLSAYYFAKTVVEITVDLILPLTFSVSIYFATGLNADIRAFFQFLVIMVFLVLQAQGIGLAFSALFMNMRYAHVGAFTFVLLSLLAAGYYIDPNNIPPFMNGLQYVTVLRYPYHALVINEMDYGREFACSPDAVSIYSKLGTACPITKHVLLEAAQLQHSLSIAGNIGVMAAWAVGTRIVGYLALKWLHTSHKPKLSAWTG